MTENKGLAKVGADVGPSGPAGARTALVKRTFDVRVDLAKPDMIEMLEAHPDVEWHETRPNPFFSTKPFQAWASEKTVFIRRIEKIDKLASPTLELRLSEKDGATEVKGRFVPADNLTRGLPKRLGGRLALVAMAAGLILGDLLILGGAFTLQAALTAIPIVALSLVARRREQASLAAHGPALLGLVGSVLLPHEIGGSESPFRALPARTSR